MGHSTPSFILDRFDLTQPKEKGTRAAGRPKTRTASYLAGLLRDYAVMADWFHLSHGRAAKSDVELLNAFLQSEFQKHGLRACRVESAEVQGRIKTLRNHLSEARHVCAAIPETLLFPGCNANHTDAH